MKKSCSGTIKRIIQSGRSTFFAVSVSVRFYCHDKSQDFIDRIRACTCWLSNRRVVDDRTW